MKKNVDQAWLEEPWFDALKPQQKLAWFYVWTKSDLVGVWSGNAKIGNIQIGYEIKWDEFQKALGSRVQIIKDGKWWLTEYCPFQFGTFSPESRVHMAAKRELNKHGIPDEESLWIGYPIGYTEPTRRLTSHSHSHSKKGSAEGKQLPELPENLTKIEGFEEGWQQFVQHRREIRKPLTALAAKGVINSLLERPGDAMDALETAIRRSWQGFEWAWFDKDRPKNGNGRPPKDGGMFLSR